MKFITENNVFKVIFGLYGSYIIILVFLIIFKSENFFDYIYVLVYMIVGLIFSVLLNVYYRYIYLDNPTNLKPFLKGFMRLQIPISIFFLFLVFVVLGKDVIFFVQDETGLKIYVVMGTFFLSLLEVITYRLILASRRIQLVTAVLNCFTFFIYVITFDRLIEAGLRNLAGVLIFALIGIIYYVKRILINNYDSSYKRMSTIYSALLVFLMWFTTVIIG